MQRLLAHERVVLSCRRRGALGHSSSRARWRLLLALVLGCGARDTLLIEGTDNPPSFPPPTGTELCEPAGVRLCGPSPCPELGFEQCPGVGCSAVSDCESGQPLDAGVCWSDVDDWFNQKCIACPEDQACVHRAEDGYLYCVPMGVCHSLFALGAGGSCRYADKSSFDDRPIAESTTCPTNDHGLICGGACLDCFTDGECIGRSSSQPFGICFHASYQPLGRSCSPDTASDCGGGELVCAVFALADGDQVVANDYGVCVEVSGCLEASAAGIVYCFDTDGHELH